jgi:hypothetical protein
MSVEFSPGYALEGRLSLGTSDAMSFLWPLKIIKTSDSAKVGAGTQFPIGFTLAELIGFIFESKTYRYQVPAVGSPNAQLAQDRKLFRGFLAMNFITTPNFVFCGSDFNDVGSFVFSGTGSGYNSYVTYHLGVQFKLDRAGDVAIGASWYNGYYLFEVRCFGRDVPESPESTVYLYDGSYYPKVEFYADLRSAEDGDPGLFLSSYLYGSAHGTSLSSAHLPIIFGESVSLFYPTGGDFAIPSGIVFGREDVF